MASSPASVALVLAILVTACSSSPSEEPNPAPSPCSIDSGFAGDDLCIQPPDPSIGLQLHAGPSAYDATTIAPSLLAPGEENVACFHLKSPNTETVHYFAQQNRMRPSSHHMIIRVLDKGYPDGWGACAPRTESIAGIPGSQVTVRDFPEGELAPENEGLARELPPHAQIEFELHYVNIGKTDVLREAWVNLMFVDPATIKGTVRTIAMIGGLGMDVAPRSREVLHYDCPIQGPSRVFELFGHFHAHTERFSAWRVRDGASDLIYESYNWNEPDELYYDTTTKNAPPDPQLTKDGGWSGTLELEEGDTLAWECEVDNTLETPLRFGNKAYDAEMCILFGGYIADGAQPMFCVGG